jgi:2-oxo-3-hexenedioate decarboxylase
MDTKALAQEILAAYTTGGMIPVLPTSRREAFDLNAAYATQAEFARLRKEAGHQIAGRKVAFVNRALWPELGLRTVAWAPMYDDTVQYATAAGAELSLARCRAPKIEPEIVFKLKQPIRTAGLDAAAVLEAVEWLALGFEIVDCPFPQWQFTPIDFVAAFGHHIGLIVGEPRQVHPPLIPTLAEQLPRAQLKLFKDGQLVEEGSGKNPLGSPALCLAELAGALLRQSGADALRAGEVITTGSLTQVPPIAAGEVWHAEVAGLPLPSLTLRLLPQ